MQGNHPALQLLRQRAAQNSLPFDRKDNFKLGLVVEGGGMRGAVSAGGLLELGNLGFRQVRKCTVLFPDVVLQRSPWTCHVPLSGPHPAQDVQLCTGAILAIKNI